MLVVFVDRGVRGFMGIIKGFKGSSGAMRGIKGVMRGFIGATKGSKGLTNIGWIGRAIRRVLVHHPLHL